jgi:hypothetical protein
MRSSSGRAPAADYNAKRNRIIDLQILEENVSKLQNYCYDEKNFKVPVIEQVLDASGARRATVRRSAQLQIQNDSDLPQGLSIASAAA